MRSMVKERFVQQGFSLVETLIAMTMLGIVMAVAIPEFTSQIERKTIKAATESVYDTIKLAHSEAIKRQASITVAIKSGANWCVGLSDAGNCNCSTANNCTIDGVQSVVNSAGYAGVSLSVSGLSGGTGNKYVLFDGIRGTASNAGSMTFSNSDDATTISINPLGLLQNCSNNIKSYSACTTP